MMVVHNLLDPQWQAVDCASPLLENNMCVVKKDSKWENNSQVLSKACDAQSIMKGDDMLYFCVADTC